MFAYAHNPLVKTLGVRCVSGSRIFSFWILERGYVLIHQKRLGQHPVIKLKNRSRVIYTHIHSRQD